MTDPQFKMTDPLIRPLLRSEATLCIEGKNAHLFYKANAGVRRELFADMEDYRCQIIYITKKMDSLMDTMGKDDATEYQHLNQQLEYFKKRISKDEKIIRELADTGVDKIYVYE